ncbi:MAG: hypothetical protein ACOX2L_01145 [Anaerolineae bacterium]|jgi:hypothetical protein|nr:hypothetical protein [Chloroflexota bacterium]
MQEAASSSDRVRYVGSRHANIDYHDGQLPPAVGVRVSQVLRANRAHPQWAEGHGWTYNHAPMLAWWEDRFYLSWLSNPVGEHTGPGQTLLTSSADGVHWDPPAVLFPPCTVPEGVYRGDPATPLPKGAQAVMHQRMGFYRSPQGRLLALGFYGISPHPLVFPNDGRGIGRVVREIRGPAQWGPIYCIRYNRHAGWNASNGPWPLYTESEDPGFVQACEALLATPLVTMQWWEEDRSQDGFYALPGYQAPSVYHAADGRAVALFKWSHTAVSADEGTSWSPVLREPSLVMAGAKVWGQRTSDGRYALVYNPSTHGIHRWPLALVSGEDGYTFDGLLRVIGEVPPRRYAGLFKDHGPQYVRGIAEGNGEPPDGALWLTCSMNKEDIWVARVPVPIQSEVPLPIVDTFADLEPGSLPPLWNLYAPLWAPVAVAATPGGDGRCLALSDWDPADHAVAERVFTPTAALRVSLRVMLAEAGQAPLQVALASAEGEEPLRLILSAEGGVQAVEAGVPRPLGRCPVGQWLDLEMVLDLEARRCRLALTGQGIEREAALDTWVPQVARLVLRTGARRRYPTPDAPTDADGDLPDAEEPVARSTWLVGQVRIAALEGEPGS